VTVSGTGAAVTVKGHVEVLLPVFGVEETVAELETVPAVLGLLTTSTTVATPLAARVPREQLTVVVPEQDDPAGAGVAETYVVPAGRTSVTVTFAARLAPVFVTTML
jgi:hypothetical protein